MKEFKGTPGPWVAHDDEESMATSVIMNDFGDILCVVGTYMTSFEEDYANANLIAAAPELLEALKELISGYEDREKSGMFDMLVHGDLIEKANAAINKALGD